MLNNSKTDDKLGAKIQEYLTSKNIHTPMISTNSKETRVNDIEHHFRKIMEILGLNLNDDSLQDTPSRVAKMYVNEIFWGLDPDNFPKCTTVDNKMGYDEMILERNINVQSNCEHHFVIIDGFAHVAYIPNSKVLGLSKMNRIVEYFSKRPQIQERLTEQIYAALCYILDTENVAVVIDAKHFCVKSRGVEDVNSSTLTSKLGGLFKNSDLRAEFFSAIRS